MTTSPLSTDSRPRGGVAVVIAAWRAAGTIRHAVSSALAQPEAAEVIVVDDESGDGGATLAAARAADNGSGRLTVIGLETNGGPARARNAAIDASSAPWVCILDSDDFLEPGRLAALLRSADGYDFVADDLIQMDAGSDRSTGKAMWFREAPAAIDITLDAFVESNISHPSRYRRELGFLKPMMRRAFLDAHSVRYDEAMRLGEDYDLYVRALAAGARFRLIPAAGYVSVMRADSLSARHTRADLANFAASDDRLLASANLTTAQQRIVQRHRLSTAKRIAWIDFIESLKAGRLAAAAGVIARDPRVAPSIGAGLMKIVGKRLSGAKA
ncbi:MAG: glycosyltransferase family 2 protein [Alphaproteobacteria bacterium]